MVQKGKSKYITTGGRYILAISTVFQDKTHIPKRVRMELDLHDGDRILWIWENDKIIIEKIE